MGLLHESMLKSEYFKVLFPYLCNKTDDEIKHLPKEYFKSNADLHIRFQMFHKQHIAVLHEVDQRLKDFRTLTERLRTDNFREVLEDIRSNRAPAQREQEN
jgi:hypothetical protein